MIDRLELLLLIRSTEQVDAVENLLERGLVSAVVNGDAITAIKTTTKGNAALKARTLPAIKE
jgi:hypothetical protein